MKKMPLFSVLLALLFLGMSACVKDNTYPYGTQNTGYNLQPGQAVLSFSTSNQWEGGSRFGNLPDNSVARTGRISGSSGNNAIGLAGYQILPGGEEGAAVLEIDPPYGASVNAGQTFYFQHPDQRTPALLSLGIADADGNLYDPWYSEAGQVYISHFNGYEIEGSFTARMFREYEPQQKLQISNGRFYARF